MRGLGGFLAYRLFRTLVALWLVSTVVFVVMRLSGDPVPLLLPPDAPIAEMEGVRHDLGLDRSLAVQYGVFLGTVIRGDFGRSIHFRQPAMAVARSYLEATFELGLVAFVVAVVVAFPIGVVSAVRRNSFLDHAAMGLALVGQSAPTFFIGILLILTLSLRLDLFPPPDGATGGTSCCRRSPSGPSRWRRSLGSRGRRCWRSFAPISSGPLAPRGSPSSGWSRSTPCETPRFRSSRSPASSSEPCLAARS